MLRLCAFIYSMPVMRIFGRGARVVESGGLENRCSPFGNRGFESHPLRMLYNPVGLRTPSF
jgi:hypothetical protein